jgi:hypothetical protein
MITCFLKMDLLTIRGRILILELSQDAKTLLVVKYSPTGGRHILLRHYLALVKGINLLPSVKISLPCMNHCQLFSSEAEGIWS